MNIPLLFVLLIIVATVAIGVLATRRAKTAGDFFVAGRGVGVLMNASAISGEYLSAASFMGIAGLVMKNGYDALWYPVGYAAGYLFLLLFIAGPLRRFGAYTIPDFAEGRFDSPAFRKIAVIFVLFIGFFYTMPQMKGAGVTMASILGWPYYAGIVVVGTVITFNVAFGGMKGITPVQAFQYWAKLFAISVPFFVLLALRGGSMPANAVGDGTPRVGEATVKMKGADAAPANAMSMPSNAQVNLSLPKGATIAKVAPARKPEPGEDLIAASDLLQIVQVGSGFTPGNEPKVAEGGFEVPAGAGIDAHPVTVTKNGRPVFKDGKPVRTGAKVEFAKAAEVTLVQGPVPNAPADAKWANPFGPFSSKWGYPLLYTYSLIIALVCGTAGLPHILVRFYTNPDGRAAKRTTLWVMVMLGAFYVFTPLWGTMGRALMPWLYANNTTDAVTIKLPTLLEGTLGQVLSGVTSAGAFAAFMSTFSGLLVSMSGAFAHDVYGRILRPQASTESRLRAFKFAAVGVGAVSMLLGLMVETFDIATMVGWAFAIGAASYFPLLLLGSWWRGLTATGAATGMLLGGLLSLGAIVSSMLLDKKVLAWDLPPLMRSLMEQPAIWGVPLSIATMVLVSLATRSKVPSDVDTKMLRLHAPEELGLSKDYIVEAGGH
ncbi:cation acetate symporter [bacterium]|nr:MAG: cation acetate symporter [bacterium]